MLLAARCCGWMKIFMQRPEDQETHKKMLLELASYESNWNWFCGCLPSPSSKLHTFRGMINEIRLMTLAIRFVVCSFAGGTTT